MIRENSNKFSITSFFIVINVMVFFLQFMISNMYGWRLENLFALNPTRVAHSYWVWQPFTYMFLHSTSSFMHILFNMYLLWIFGVPVEEVWGRKSFLAYYLFSGVGAGVSILLLNYFIAPYSSTLGASGVVFAMLLAFGLTFPDTELLLFFVLPVKAKYLVVLYGLLELFFMFSNTGSNISHIGHIGGLLSGLLFLFLFKRRIFLTGSKVNEIDESLIKELRQFIQEKANRIEESNINEKLEKTKNRALLIQDQLKTKSLDAAEQKFLNDLLNGVPQSEWKNICEAIDFGINDKFCNRCNLFPVCLNRYVTNKDPNYR